MKRATAKDVAAATGYSVESVYAALRNSPHASQKATQIIQKTAQEMGYSVDPVLSVLGQQRWKNSGTHAGANLVFFISESRLKRNQVVADQLKEYTKQKGYLRLPPISGPPVKVEFVSKNH